MNPRGERGNGSPPPETLLALAGGTNSSSPPTTLPYEGLKRNFHLLLHAVACTRGERFPRYPPFALSQLRKERHADHEKDVGAGPQSLSPRKGSEVAHWARFMQ